MENCFWSEEYCASWNYGQPDQVAMCCSRSQVKLRRGAGTESTRSLLLSGN
ncbi:UNVERIFIED_CONTAM: hypothetical protein Sradi_6255800 [Sesamum radiatum]|uniref:Uncharacterized protein n=1 Tax=Sesamum radiatum TaxID=300843 RepID=A0AAW2KCD7_SESRA